MKIIDLNAKVFTKKIIKALVFKIDCNGIYMAMFLLNQNIIVLFQLILLGFEIQCLKILVFFLVSCFINIIIKIRSIFLNILL